MRKTILTLALALVALGATAQDTTAINNSQPEQQYHYILLEGGGGLGSFLHDGQEGKGVLSHGATFSLSYEYMFHRRWGIGVGVGASYLTAQTRYQDHFYIEQNLIHPDNQRLFDSHVQFSNWREDQKMWAVNIPVQLINYEPLSKDWALLTRVGLMVNVPVQSRYVLKEGEFATKGYFPSTNVLYDNDTYVAMDSHGFGKRKAEGQEGDMNVRPVNLSAQVEFGALYRLHKNVSLYFGLYADCGMLNYARSNQSQLYDSDSRQYMGAYQTTDIRSIRPIEAGVKVGFRFGMVDRKPEQNDCFGLQMTDTVVVHDTIIRVDTVKQVETIYRTDTVVITRETVVAMQDSILQEILMSAHFQSGSYAPIFEEGAENLFDQLKQAMSENPDHIILITGHTDSTGPADKNMELGQQRADAFRDALVRKGIDRKRIITISRGEEEPIAPNNTPEGRAANRRVQLKMK